MPATIPSAMPPKKMSISDGDMKPDSLEWIPHKLRSKTRKPSISQRKSAAQPAKTTELTQKTLPHFGHKSIAEVVGAVTVSALKRTTIFSAECSGCSKNVPPRRNRNTIAPRLFSAREISCTEIWRSNLPARSNRTPDASHSYTTRQCQRKTAQYQIPHRNTASGVTNHNADKP